MMPVAAISAASRRKTWTAVTSHFARCASLTAAEKTYLETLINGLISDGLWTLLDVLTVPKGTEADSLLNLKSSSFDLTNVNGCSFVASQGWTVDATGSKYIDTNYTPGGVGSQASLNSVMSFCYKRTTVNVVGSYNFGTIGSSGQQLLFCKMFSGAPNYNMSISCFANESALGVGLSNLAGFLAVSRTNAIQHSLAVNNSFYTPPNKSSLYVADMSVYIGAANYYGPINFATGNQYSCWGSGSGMTQAQLNNLYARIQAYMTSIGSAV